MAWEPVKVLLVEEREEDARITRELLRQIGAERFEVEWLQESDSALSALEQRRHDVCLVHDRLGGRAAVEFIRRAVSRSIDVPIIVLAGEPDWEADLAAMEAGAADFLTKNQLTPPLLERVIRYSIQQKRMERARYRLLQEQAARREAEAANKAKDDFLAMLSHELRTPLNAILGWVQLMKTGSLDGQATQQAIDTIDRSARAQSRLIEDLLDISRIQSGKVRLEKMPVKLSNVVNAAIDGVLPSAEARAIKLEREVEDAGVVIGDATRLQQVTWNLLTNAVKFTPEGGTVSVTLVQEEGAARLTIRDTGQGIDRAFLPYVFDRFKQGDNQAAVPAQRGLGLGLAIVRQLAEMHGGSVKADSEGPGKGSTFTVVLPLATGDIPLGEPGDAVPQVAR